MPESAVPQPLTFLVHLSVLLLCVVVLGRLAVRARLPAITGELCAGVLLGPSLLGSLPARWSDWLPQLDSVHGHALNAVAQLGLLLLVGLTGAQLDLRMLRSHRLAAVRISGLGLVVPALLGVALGLCLPAALLGEKADRLGFAVFIGVALSVTAIPVLAKTLSDMRLLHSGVGQLALAASVIDAAIVWLILSVVAAWTGGGSAAADAARAVLTLLGFIAVAWSVGRRLTRLLLGWAKRSGEQGLTIATAVLLVLLLSTAAAALELEPVFGAFVGGVLIAGAADHDGVPLDPALLAPLRTVVLSVLAPVFLATAGLLVDFRALADPRIAAAGAAVLAVAIIGKFAGAYLGARLSRLGHWEGVALGVGMNARGVVEIVVATVGLRLGVLSGAAFTVLVLVAVTTSVMTPPLLRTAMAHVHHSAEDELRVARTERWTHADQPTAARLTIAENERQG